jgi:alpha-mannosidase
MGGWFLQPDCISPAGEGIIRQIIAGRRFFSRHFHATPSVAVNFDPLGHSRGLVQILAKSGFKGYVFCRPDKKQCDLPSEVFIWRGFNSSSVVGIRLPPYLTPLGGAKKRIEETINKMKEGENILIPWGIGNHGGGASCQDLCDIRKLIKETPGVQIKHSTPEEYLKDLKDKLKSLPAIEKSLHAALVGCYASQNHIKKEYRHMEAEVFLTEKIMSTLHSAGILDYPSEKINEAVHAMLFAQFHDILPGSSIPSVEQYAIQLIHYTRHILRELRASAFFSLIKTGKKLMLKKQQATQSIPILVYNPHHYPMETTINCEFQMPDQNWEETFTDVHVYAEGSKLAAQVEKEASNLTLDWRKHVIFNATLKPYQMNRFECKLVKLPARPPIKSKTSQFFNFRNDRIQLTINTRTGCIDKYVVDGKALLKNNACRLLVLQDSSDTWAMDITKFQKLIGSFKVIPTKHTPSLTALNHPIQPARIIEDGAVRTVLEILLEYNQSKAVLRYKLPKKGTEIEIECRIYWNEKDKMLKLALPFITKEADAIAQTVFGIEPIPTDGRECVTQKWCMLYSKNKKIALSCINDTTYGCDFKNGEMRLSMLRAPAYAALPILSRPLVPQDRFTPRINQGEHIFNFWLNGATYNERIKSIQKETQIKYEPPFALPVSPITEQKIVTPLIHMSNNTIELVTAKKAENNDDLIIRLFEPTRSQQETSLTIPALNIKTKIKMAPFEIKTFRINRKTRKIMETDLMEMPI